jgi:hypothetical protein
MSRHRSRAPRSALFAGRDSASLLSGDLATHSYTAQESYDLTNIGFSRY